MTDYWYSRIGYVVFQAGYIIPDLVLVQVRESQAAFDRQFEQTKILLTDADRKSSEFCVYLEEFIRSQVII